MSNLPLKLSQLEASRLAADVADALGEVEQLWQTVPVEVFRLELSHVLRQFAGALGPQRVAS